MGINQRIVIFCMLLCFIIVLSACGDSFRTANISLYETSLSEVQARSGAAYYLSNDGMLYCTGADSDSSSFVVYQNQAKGIVAENVKSFGEYAGGGYYIDQNNDLYMWNKESLPLYGYDHREKHIKILSAVKFVSSSTNSLIYVDVNDNLYLIGTLSEELYSVKDPKLLARDVICADVNNGVVVWAKTNGEIGFYGNADPAMATELAARFADSCITNICLEKDYITILSDDQLWFYGDYDKLISGEGPQAVELTLLDQGISNISCSVNTVIALDTNGKVLLWGRCISNDAQNTERPQFAFYEAYCLTQNAKSVFVSDSCVCYVDKDGKSNIFYASGWPTFYGNATKDSCVGIKREPNKWIK